MALTKVIGTGVGNLDALGVGTASPSHPLHIVTSTDGTGVSGDDKFVAVFQNAEATDGRSYGVKIMAGSTSDQAFAITDHDGSNDLMSVDGYGHVLMPKQSAFAVYKTSGQNNIAINSGNTITWDAEYFDNNSDFASNTFTAPVTGKYLLGCRLRTDNVDSGATYYYIMIATSNRNYYNIMSPDRFSGDPTYFFFQITELTDMDANDTAYISFYQAGGTAQTDIDTGAKSSFWGHLVC